MPRISLLGSLASAPTPLIVQPGAMAAALALATPSAHAAEHPWAPWAFATLGLVAVALGGLAAVLAYRLGRQAAPGWPATPAAPGRVAVPGVPAVATRAQARQLADALPGPAVVLVADGADWQWFHGNAAAGRAWPEGAAGAWPEGLRASVTAPGTDSAGPAGPWLCLPGPEWRLAWQPAATTAPAATEAAQRLQAESFGFTLSHDLRAPLRVVEGFTRIVKEDYGGQLDRVGNDHLERVLGAAARMNLMIDAMLALARLSQQPLSRQPVDLSQLAGFVVEELRRGAPDRVVEVDIEPALTARGDPTLLRLVLDNLLGNAWKYTAKAASPRIELRREPTAATGELGFVVRDNGAGFDMRSADRLFGLFQRLHSASDFPGHGVGLASVRRIVERHGGRVWAESEPGRGASFHVVLGAG